MQQRRLPGAVGADQCDALAERDGETRAAHCNDAAIGRSEIAYL